MSTAPYYRGYTVMCRKIGDGRWEVWHYASDRLVHVATSWSAAKAWADAHSAIPACGEVSRDWNHIALHR